MLNLFEAAQLRVHGEDILDEALDFTHTHLKSMTNQLSSSFAAQISHCLRKPLHKGVSRLEARRYISFYEEDPSHCKVLLTFAKLDFNMLQELHQKEVASITKWWKTRKVPYARVRVVEGYLWPLAMSYEPEYSIARKMESKLIGCISLLDDTYDAYGTIEELELFTQAIQSWDISSIQSLSESMKVLFDAIVELCDEIKLTTSSMVVQCIKQAFCNLARAYLVEAKWRHEHYIPTYHEYKDNGVISSTCPLQITSFVLLANFSTQEMFDWILSDPTIIKAVSLIGRLENDISSHKFEQQRMHVASAVECCMKQYNISQKETYKFIKKDIEDFWKVINEECLKSKCIPKPVLDCILNVARITELTYENFKDKYTNGKLLKDYIVALLVDPISIEQHE
uniref:(+)-delta-cadinene synthase isozyme A n=1 Tax=Cajanus cajan TaxID=3821 RepID=A0A151QYW9_CAJCA|nr:(+)-delta-cadinene synthase isozyme A [Cajanus cajan]